METGEARPRTLGAFAVLFALLALSNLLKPLRLEGDTTGFVFFGHRLTGTANAIAGPLFGVFLLAYALGIWRMRRWALPMGAVYAAYVAANLILFYFVGPKEPGIGYAIFSLVYAVVAIGVSFGTVRLLQRHRAALT